MQLCNMLFEQQGTRGSSGGLLRNKKKGIAVFSHVKNVNSKIVQICSTKILTVLISDLENLSTWQCY